jgi:hypothetical protein
MKDDTVNLDDRRGIRRIHRRGAHPQRIIVSE